MILTSLKVDGVLAEDGVWCQFDKDSKIKIARHGSTRYNNALAASYLISQVDGVDHTSVTEQKIINEAISKLVIDWDGFNTEDGTPIPFNAEEHQPLLNDLKYPT